MSFWRTLFGFPERSPPPAPPLHLLLTVRVPPTPPPLHLLQAVPVFTPVIPQPTEEAIESELATVAKAYFDDDDKREDPWGDLITWLTHDNERYRDAIAEKKNALIKAHRIAPDFKP